MIDPDVKLGKSVKIFFPDLVNIYGCKIGDFTTIAPFVEITRGVIIGKRCKISSHSFLCTAVTLENDVFIGHGVMFTNDLYPRSDKMVKYLPTIVKSGASLGSGSVILASITIGKNAIIGGGSVVTKNVPDLTIVAGNPARILKSFKTYQQMSQYMSKGQAGKKR